MIFAFDTNIFPCETPRRPCLYSRGGVCKGRSFQHQSQPQSFINSLLLIL